MPNYTLFCKFTPEQKDIILKNPHTLHFFCHYDNLKIIKIDNYKEIIEDNSDLSYKNGYTFTRNFTNVFPDSFNITYDDIKNMYYQNTIKYKLDKNFPKLDYQDRRHRPTSTLHTGQIKLFLTTLQFMTNYIPKNKEVHILYPGSAFGQNIYILSNLFPNCYWYLIDPSRFYNKLHNNNKVLYMSNKLFFNKDAEYFKKLLKNKFTVFMCDIRNLETFTIRDTKEILIDIDMRLQYDWCKTFNADISFLKFRIPRASNEYKYLDGELIIQPFAPKTSTETRLVVMKNAKDKIYNLDDYEDKMYYHNRILRVCNYKNLHNYKNKYFCNCFDCSSFFLIIEDYLKKNDVDLTVYTLIEKVFKHMDYYQFFKISFNDIINNIN